MSGLEYETYAFKITYEKGTPQPSHVFKAMSEMMIEVVMIKYDLYKLLKDELGNGSSDLVTRPSGNKIRERIEKDIAKEKDGAVVALDFSKVGIIDFSCADEIVTKLVSRLVSGEYGDRYIILTGLNENQKENIEVALERKDLAVMGVIKNRAKTLIGNLDNYLKQTLNLILDRGNITAKELSEALELPANTSGTRLLNLYKKRLVMRTEEMRESGRVWVYTTVQ